MLRSISRLPASLHRHPSRSFHLTSTLASSSASSFSVKPVTAVPQPSTSTSASTSTSTSTSTSPSPSTPTSPSPPPHLHSTQSTRSSSSSSTKPSRTLLPRVDTGQELKLISQGQPPWENKYADRICALYPAQIYGSWLPWLYDSCKIRTMESDWYHILNIHNTYLGRYSILTLHMWLIHRRIRSYKILQEYRHEQVQTSVKQMGLLDRLWLCSKVREGNPTNTMAPPILPDVPADAATTPYTAPCTLTTTNETYIPDSFTYGMFDVMWDTMSSDILNFLVMVKDSELKNQQQSILGAMMTYDECMKRRAELRIDQPDDVLIEDLVPDEPSRQLNEYDPVIDGINLYGAIYRNIFACDPRVTMAHLYVMSQYILRERTRLETLHIQDIMQGYIPWGPPPSHADLQRAIVTLPKQHPQLMTIHMETFNEPMINPDMKIKLKKY